MPLRVLVVDDSSLFRRVVAEALATIPDVEVVASAPNGKLALHKVAGLKPDLLTLDIEMPEMDGLAVLESLRQMGSTTSVMVISGITQKGGRLTMQALEKGAFDFITKPQGSSAEESKAILVKELAPKIRALLHRRQIQGILQTLASPGSAATAAVGSAATVRPAVPQAEFAAPSRSPIARPEIVLVGVSTGGPAALLRLLPPLPRDIGVPIVVVQHMPPMFTQALAESLASKCSLQVREASDGEKLEAGTVLIAPGGKHLRLVAGRDGSVRAQTTEDPPENNCRPAVDHLFRSVANNLPGRAMAVILTGMGNDGTIGLRLLRRAGCFTIAQDESTSVVFGMPKSAIEAGLVDTVLPIDAIPAKILATVRGRGP